jgi:hypothetical protein
MHVRLAAAVLVRLAQILQVSADELLGLKAPRRAAAPKEDSETGASGSASRPCARSQRKISAPSSGSSARSSSQSELRAMV